MTVHWLHVFVRGEEHTGNQSSGINTCFFQDVKTPMFCEETFLDFSKASTVEANRYCMLAVKNILSHLSNIASSVQLRDLKCFYHGMIFVH